MVPDTQAKSSRPGLSLYANLLDPSSKQESAPGTISRAPVVFKQAAGDEAQQDRAAAERQQISAAALRFQPTKRPQLSAQKPKSKPPVQRAPAPVTASKTAEPNIAEPTNAVTRSSAKTTLADWTAEVEENDVNGFYGGEKRQRGGRKKRKKNKEMSHILQNWDDIYDPSRPNNYEDYKHSDEKIIEMREWKNKLYAHRISKRRDSDSDSSNDDFRPQTNKRYAPPDFSFAPPNFDASDKAQVNSQPVNVPDGPTGEDAYTRRMRLSQSANERGSSHQTLNRYEDDIQRPITPPPPPPPPPPATSELHPTQPPPPASTNVIAATNISRAPVRYNLPAAPSEIPTSEAGLADALQMEHTATAEETGAEAVPRSLRPGQKGFAERLMSKYGWSKGSGLGASGSGIVNPLRVQVEKQKKKPDSEGGGFVGPGGRGKIIGGKKKGGAGPETEEGKFGAMSEVVILRGMVDGMDLDAELENSGDGGLMQEIGEECGEKYGRVERVFIDRSDRSKAPVFVKFTSQLSALRAVNALEGRNFNGNTIVAKFYDAEKFEAGIYNCGVSV